MSKILLIEDDDAITSAYSAFLDRAGYESECVTNGSEGLQKFKSYKPDLIILDLFMPVLSGIEFLEILHAMPDKKPKVIVSSNTLDPETESLVKSLGASASILKADTSVHELLSIIRTVLSTD